MKKRRVLLIILVIIAVIAVYYVYNYRKKSEFLKEYASNVFLFKNYFVYSVKVKFDDSSVQKIEMVKSDKGIFDLYDPDSTPLNVCIANAIVVDSTGKCITSKYATEPWNNANEVSTLTNMLYKEMHDVPVVSIAVSGRSVYMSVISSKSYIENNGLSASEREIEYTLPDTINADANIAYIIRKDGGKPMKLKNIHIGHTLYKNAFLIGYAKNTDLNNLNDAPSPTIDLISFKNTSVTATSDENTQLDMPDKILAEGAPMFDRSGNLVAINTVSNDSYKPVFVDSVYNSLPLRIPQINYAPKQDDNTRAGTIGANDCDVLKSVDEPTVVDGNFGTKYYFLNSGSSTLEVTWTIDNTDCLYDQQKNPVVIPPGEKEWIVTVGTCNFSLAPVSCKVVQ